MVKRTGDDANKNIPLENNGGPKKPETQFEISLLHNGPKNMAGILTHVSITSLDEKETGSKEIIIKGNPTQRSHQKFVLGLILEKINRALKDEFQHSLRDPIQFVCLDTQNKITHEAPSLIEAIEFPGTEDRDPDLALKIKLEGKNAAIAKIISEKLQGLNNDTFLNHRYEEFTCLRAQRKSCASVELIPSEAEIHAYTRTLKKLFPHMNQDIFRPGRPKPLATPWEKRVDVDPAENFSNTLDAMVAIGDVSFRDQGAKERLLELVRAELQQRTRR